MTRSAAGSARTRAGGFVHRVGLIALIAGAPPALAAQVGSGDLLSVEIHGFASLGFLLTTGNDYLTSSTKNGSFELSEIGINLTKVLTDELRFGVQIFAQDLGPRGDWTPRVDWFYLDYRWTDWLGFRAGRLKIPYGLHNEISDVDAARVPVLLPQSVYPLQTREFLFAQTGVELYGFARSDVLGAIDYRLFGGTIFIDPLTITPVGSPVELDIDVPYVVGGRLTWETPLEGLRIAGSFQALGLDVLAHVPGLMMPVVVENRSYLTAGSIEYTLADLVLTAEYARWHTFQETTPGGVLESDSDRAYGMAHYRFAPWIQAGAYYSIFLPQDEERMGPARYQHDVAATLRFDVSPFWLIKLEGHFMSGTAGLDSPLRVGVQTGDVAEHWGVFIAKTTAYF